MSYGSSDNEDEEEQEKLSFGAKLRYLIQNNWHYVVLIAAIIAFIVATHGIGAIPVAMGLGAVIPASFMPAVMVGLYALGASGLFIATSAIATRMLKWFNNPTSKSIFQRMLRTIAPLVLFVEHYKWAMVSAVMFGYALFATLGLAGLPSLIAAMPAVTSLPAAFTTMFSGAVVTAGQVFYSILFGGIAATGLYSSASSIIYGIVKHTVGWGRDEQGKHLKNEKIGLVPWFLRGLIRPVIEHRGWITFGMAVATIVAPFAAVGIMFGGGAISAAGLGIAALGADAVGAAFTAIIAPIASFFALRILSVISSVIGESLEGTWETKIPTLREDLDAFKYRAVEDDSMDVGPYEEQEEPEYTSSARDNNAITPYAAHRKTNYNQNTHRYDPQPPPYPKPNTNNRTNNNGRGRSSSGS
ncbi:MAG TPA: hypothetical protein VLG38_05690 [Gammaproteobacteria bacterium]|nr:hypothetical protein [Gammaproteobacteria bacterium]